MGALGGGGQGHCQGWMGTWTGGRPPIGGQSEWRSGGCPCLQTQPERLEGVRALTSGMEGLVPQALNLKEEGGCKLELLGI